jgi:hypothetical protein
MKNLHKDTDDYHHGNKVRHIGYGLEDLFITPVFDGIEAEGEDNGDRETRDDGVKGDTQGVPNHPRKHIGIEEFFKIGQTHPGTAPDASKNGVFPEGNLNPQHGNIGKDDDIDGGEKQKKVELPISSVFLL